MVAVASAEPNSEAKVDVLIIKPGQFPAGGQSQLWVNIKLKAAVIWA